MAWLVWDVQDNEWFSDCPVLLSFTGEQVEVNHQKFDDPSITWNTVGPHRVDGGDTRKTRHLVTRRDVPVC